jgi:putative transposase
MHIIQRGNNRKACFFADEDYAVYLDRLAFYGEKYQVHIHAFVLMTNHVHLLLTPTTPSGVSQLMQSLGRYYVRYINQTYQRSGTLWEGRFKSSLIDSDRYFLTVSRYIELNPVRAGMVEHPAEYPWTSYQYNALGKPIKMMTEHKLYTELGADDKARQENYRALFDQQIAQRTIDEIRQAANKTWVLGDDRFKQEIELELGRRIEVGKHGGDRKSKSFLEENQRL